MEKRRLVSFVIIFALVITVALSIALLAVKAIEEEKVDPVKIARELESSKNGDLVKYKTGRLRIIKGIENGLVRYDDGCQEINTILNEAQSIERVIKQCNPHWRRLGLEYLVQPAYK